MRSRIMKTCLFKYTENFTTKKNMKNSDIFHISSQNIDCGYSLEPPQRGGSNEYLQSMFLSRNEKNNVYPCKPQYYYIRGSKLYSHVFVMGSAFDCRSGGHKFGSQVGHITSMEIEHDYSRHSTDSRREWPRWLSWMRRPTGDQEVAGSTLAEVGNILSWRLIMKYFLRSFSPFR